MIRKIFPFLAIFSLAILTTTFFVSYQDSKNKNLITQPEEFGLGFIINQNQDDMLKYTELIKFLNNNSPDNWYLIPVKDYGSFIDHLKSGNLKVGFMGSAISYKLIKESIAVPVAREEINGISTYDGQIIVRKDSGITNISELKNKKIAFVDPYTSASYLFPIYHLKINGYEPEQFFRVSTFLNSHEKVIQEVWSGNYDGGAIKSTALERLAAQNELIKKELRVIEKMGPFPENTLMVSTELSPQKISSLKNLLLNMNNIPAGQDFLSTFGIDKFISTEVNDFNSVKAISNF